MLRAVEQSPLRPAPLAPPGPVDPADARATIARPTPPASGGPGHRAGPGSPRRPLARRGRGGHRPVRRGTRRGAGHGPQPRCGALLSRSRGAAGACARSGTSPIGSTGRSTPRARRCWRRTWRTAPAARSTSVGWSRPRTQWWPASGREPSEDIPPPALTVVENAEAAPAGAGGRGPSGDGDRHAWRCCWRWRRRCCSPRSRSPWARSSRAGPPRPREPAPATPRGRPGAPPSSRPAGASAPGPRSRGVPLGQRFRGHRARRLVDEARAPGCPRGARGRSRDAAREGPLPPGPVALPSSHATSVTPWS